MNKCEVLCFETHAMHRLLFWMQRMGTTTTNAPNGRSATNVRITLYRTIPTPSIHFLQNYKTNQRSVLKCSSGLHKYMRLDMESLDISSLLATYRYLVKIKDKLEHTGKSGFRLEANHSHPWHGINNLIPRIPFAQCTCPLSVHNNLEHYENIHGPWLGTTKSPSIQEKSSKGEDKTLGLWGMSPLQSYPSHRTIKGALLWFWRWNVSLHSLTSTRSN